METIKTASGQQPENGIQGKQSDDIKENNPEMDYKRDMFKFKNKFKEVESEKEELLQKLKEYENQEQQRQGNYQAVIDDLKTQLSDERKRTKEREVREAKNKVETSIEMYAKELGCKDTKAFLKLLDESYIETVSIDKESLNPLQEDIKMLVESGVKKYEHLGLFDKKINLVDSTPSRTPLNKPEKSIKEMSSEELQNYIKQRYK